MQTQPIRMVSIILFSITILYVCLSCFYQVSPTSTVGYFHTAMGLSTKSVAYISALYFISYALMQIPNGILIDRFGIPYVLPIGIFITLIGSILYWLTPTPEVFAISRIIIGLGASVAYISAIYIGITLFPITLLPMLIGLAEAFSTLGYILATNTYQDSIDRFGWNTTSINLIIINIILLILVIILVKMQYGNSSNSDEEHSHKNISNTLLVGLRLFKNRTFTAIIIYTFFTWMQIMAFAGYWGKQYFQTMHEYSEAKSLSLMAVFWGGYLLVSLLIGPIAKQYGRKKPLLLLLSAIALITSIIMSIPILFSYLTLIIISAVLGASISGIILSFAMIADIAPHSLKGSAIATNNTVLILGGLIGQYLFGLLTQNGELASILPSEINAYDYIALLMLPACAAFAFISILIGTKNYHD